MRETYESLHKVWQACEALANDQSTTGGERENARRRADEFRAKLDELEQQTINVADANYEYYVAQGLQARKNIHTCQWALGALARNVAIEYGKRRLQKYAEDIDMEYGTLRNYRATFEAWSNPVGRPENFAIAAALNPHPDRYKIVERFPNLTFREAQEMTRSYKSGSTPRASQQQTAPPPPPNLTLERAREMYLKLALKLSMRERTREAIKIVSALGVKMS